MFGFINLNKPRGLTSHNCISKIRRLLNIKKVGHGGTLDPLATGVLPIAVGKATRLLQFLPEQKAYRARIRLGVTTTTDDLEGEVLTTKSTTHLSREAIVASLEQFQGEIEQIPPVYSAIKKNGQKMYELARKGIDVEVPPRIVTIDSIEVIDFILGDFLEVDVAITCGSGTYIRAIARDLGQTLGVGGTLANLVRTKSCGMSLDSSLSFEELEAKLRHNQSIFIEPAQALPHLPAIILNSHEADKWLQGQTVPIVIDEVQAGSTLERGSTLHSQNLSLSNQRYYRTHDRENNHFLGISIINQDTNITKCKQAKPLKGGVPCTLAKPKIVCINVRE